MSTIKLKLKNTTPKNQAVTFTNIAENIITSLEASPTGYIDTIVHSKSSNTNPNETKESDKNSKLLDDRTLFSSDTVNTLSLIDLKKHNITKNNNINTNNTVNDTPSNIKI